MPRQQISCRGIVLLHCGLAVGKLLISSIHLAAGSLLHLIPALFLCHIKQLGLGLVALVQNLQKLVTQLSVDALRCVGIIIGGHLLLARLFLGIQTDTPERIARMKDLWGE